MLKYLFHFAVILSCYSLSAQIPFSQKKYDYRVESNLAYGTALNFFGQIDTLKLDLYKPIMDGETQRPVIIAVHGGGWLGGCKSDWQSGIVGFSKEMASRGYVVASINYRLGMHHTPTDPGLLNPYKCQYLPDTCEAIRAAYRAAQDTKAAIRWMKDRTSIDSTCNERVFLAGESAGGFNVLAAALLDRPSEKPACCLALPDAPAPWPLSGECATYDCVVRNIVPSGNQLKRPDLGPVEGTLNTSSGQNTDVLGIASFYGGVLAQALPLNWLQGPDTPAMYFYHQTCDAVVPFNSGKVNESISAYCNLGFSPWHGNLPTVYGSGSLSGYLSALPSPPNIQTDFVPCANFEPSLALFECLRFNDNGAYHYIIDIPGRAQKVADFFGNILLAQMPPCTVSAVQDMQEETYFSVSPNPARATIQISIPKELTDPSIIELFTTEGQLIYATIMPQGAKNVWIQRSPDWPPGLYFAHLKSAHSACTKKILLLD